MTTCIRREGSLWTKCRCSRCRARNVRLAKYARAGLLRAPDRDAAIGRVRAWHAEGFTDEWIASACGVNRWQIQRIAHRTRNGLPLRAYHATTRLILAADIRNGSSGSGPALGIARRIQALNAIGHTQDHIAAATGMAQGLLSRIANGHAQHVSAGNYRLIVEHYERACMTPGQSKRAITNARKKGWAPPLAWDEDAIDDPTAVPFMEPDRRVGGEKFTLGDVEDCIEWGLSRDQAAHRLGVSKSAIEHRCDRDGRLELLVRLDRNAIVREAS